MLSTGEGALRAVKTGRILGFAGGEGQGKKTAGGYAGRRKVDVGGVYAQLELRLFVRRWL